MRAVRRRGLPMVVDADGLWLVNQDISLVAGGWVGGNPGALCGACACAVGWQEACRQGEGLARSLRSCTPQPCLPARPAAGYRNAVLTPNKVEFQRLADRLNVELDSPQALQSICQRWVGGCCCCCGCCRGSGGEHGPCPARRCWALVAVSGRQ